MYHNVFEVHASYIESSINIDKYNNFFKFNSVYLHANLTGRKPIIKRAREERKKYIYKQIKQNNVNNNNNSGNNNYYSYSTNTIKQKSNYKHL
jgi:hypothetical protein